MRGITSVLERAVRAHALGGRAANVVDRMGNVTNVVLRIAGVWGLDERTLLHAPLEPIPRRAIEAAAQRLAPLRSSASTPS